MSIEAQFITRLTTAFAPTTLKVTNDSHQHAGHMGDDGSGASHFSIYIRADDLAPLSRLARHRAVHAALGDLTTRVHAIAIDAA
jgi:BolA family transcriptional regulator, general stress-responsive regulator